MFKKIYVVPERPTNLLMRHPNLMIYEIKVVDEAFPGLGRHDHAGLDLPQLDHVGDRDDPGRQPAGRSRLCLARSQTAAQLIRD